MFLCDHILGFVNIGLRSILFFQDEPLHLLTVPVIADLVGALHRQQLCAGDCDAGIGSRCAQQPFQRSMDVRAWLFTVARNAYYDHCRRAKHAAPLEDAETKAADSPDIAQLLVDKDAAFTVHQCLHALEEPYKEVFSLRVFGELPFDRIGAIFSHNAAWARVTYYRAKTRIQTMLEQQK